MNVLGGRLFRPNALDHYLEHGVGVGRPREGIYSHLLPRYIVETKRANQVLLCRNQLFTTGLGNKKNVFPDISVLTAMGHDVGKRTRPQLIIQMYVGDIYG